MYQYEVVLRNGRTVNCFADNGLEVCMKCPNAKSFKIIKKVEQ